MNEEKINLVEGPITAETLAEKHNSLGRGLTRYTTPADASPYISKEEGSLVIPDISEIETFSEHKFDPETKEKEGPVLSFQDSAPIFPEPFIKDYADSLLTLPAAETPIEKSRFFHADEAPFIPDVTKVQNHSQAGQLGKEIELDSASELVNAERPAIEHPVVNIVVNQEENSVTATYGGKTLIERNPGDWFVQGAFQIIQSALRAAWKTKFKETLPSEFQTSFSFNGGFSMGGKRNLFTAPPARPKRVSKHAAGQSKKKKRK